MTYPQRQAWRAGAALLVVVLGLAWLACGWRAGVLAATLTSIPGLVLSCSAFWLLCHAGSHHLEHRLVLVTVVSVPLAIMLFWAISPMYAFALACGGALCAWIGGYAALLRDMPTAGVPAPEITPGMAAKAVLDETVLAFFLACASIPRGCAITRDRTALEQLEAALDNNHWQQQPETLHGTVQAPEPVECKRVHKNRQTFDLLSFDSDYTVLDALPQADQWHAHRANQRAHARVLRHDHPAPWLLCLHGYQMGTPSSDFSLFRIEHLHQQLGLNLIMPILPLHGLRRSGWPSGSGFLDGPMATVFHAQVQALSDIRRCLAWVRTLAGGDTVGVLGYSLGGYNAALLAACEPDLACVIAGIPLTDIPAILWRHMPPADRAAIEAQGINLAWLNQLMAPVSPLQHTPVLPHDRRYVFAATGDRIVPAQQALDLWRHWDEPAMHWYQGTHISVRREQGAAQFINRALHDCGLVVSGPQWETV